ncbi:hypothetical protein Trisim1_006000 [Trichoderma cf. simile WF8]
MTSLFDAVDSLIFFDSICNWLAHFASRLDQASITTISGLPVPDSWLWRSGPTLDETFRPATTWYIPHELLDFCPATLKYEIRHYFVPQSQLMDTLQGPDGRAVELLKKA